MYSGGSVSEEVERRMNELFEDDEMRKHLDKLYRLLRSYLQTLGRRFSTFGEYYLAKHVEALNLGFELSNARSPKGSSA